MEYNGLLSIFQLIIKQVDVEHLLYIRNYAEQWEWWQNQLYTTTEKTNSHKSRAINTILNKIKDGILTE